ncbi:MAG TPA: methyltransferase domain-containing protein [Actinocrinis sp.]|nr:methyltransferase domain-containing protein [Actinocrinis sp.]
MFPDWQSMTDAQHERWETVLGTLAAALPPHAAGVIVDGEHAQVVADRIAHALRSTGRHCVRITDQNPLADEDAWRIERGSTTIALADGPRWRENPPTGRWELAIWLRTTGDHPGTGPANSNSNANSQTKPAGEVVLDLADPSWPIIRRVSGAIAMPEHWYVAETQAFFAVRAATWDSKFGDDLPAYAAAVAEAAPPLGGTALDLGCGTGRALPALRAAVGPTGRVIGLDLTSQMLDAVRSSSRDRDATALLLGDARRLPLADASIDAVFAAGLLNHLDKLSAGLSELARVTRLGGQLIIFHPTGSAALAARHGRVLGAHEPLAEHMLGAALAGTGWKLDYYDDPVSRFLALATRT